MRGMPYLSIKNSIGLFYKNPNLLLNVQSV